MQDIKKKIISIGGTSAIKKKDTGEIIGLNILTEENGKEFKYAMWFTRGAKEANKEEVAGNRYPSAASIAFKEQQMTIGSKVGVAYVEEEREYKYEDKQTKEIKTAKAMNRTIRWFSQPDNIEEFDEESKGQQLDRQKIEPNSVTVDDLPEEIEDEEIPFS